MLEFLLGIAFGGLSIGLVIAREDIEEDNKKAQGEKFTHEGVVYKWTKVPTNEGPFDIDEYLKSVPPFDHEVARKAIEAVQGAHSGR